MSDDRHPLDTARDAVTPYGYAILPDGTLVTPKGKETGVKLVCLPRGRYQARAKERDTLLWSGPNPAKFLESYWYARRIA